MNLGRGEVRLPHLRVIFQVARLPTSRRTVGMYSMEDIVTSVDRGEYRTEQSHAPGNMGDG